MQDALPVVCGSFVEEASFAVVFIDQHQRLILEGNHVP